MKRTLLFILALVCIFSIGTVAFGFSGDLTGVWKGNDGGTYYIRQIGTQIYWYGEQSPENPGWAHVAVGKISDNRIHLDFCTVPKGEHINNGTLSVLIVSNNELVKESSNGVNGNFGCKRWIRE